MVNVISDKELLSKVITFLRFPLIVGVVMLHMLNYNGVNITGENYPIYYYTTHVLTECLARLAVPLFFIFSGYLFFCKVDYFTKDIYKQKVKTRMRTLLVPYLFWNILLLVFMVTRRFILPREVEGNPMSEWTLFDWFNSYWASIRGMPISLQFWFIRDLFILVLLSPCIYYILKLNRFLIGIFGVLWFFFVMVFLVQGSPYLPYFSFHLELGSVFIKRILLFIWLGL